ncbi:MAG: pentapeptide repeat-containing protein [Tychonema bourrellyi B0820]|uniref:Stress protein n=1 Tax=Tychonema bourrellyi FEM_GT703 TaxID=2040638 RepID=A0A2G4EWD4_9CYAN|nr:pentapeptide repeat-containing protein [Tychonema bourrellyi]MDQ2098085.1 pentapeptide repeat-containing protein [Tychonema bourrellyi B0820]PHX53843.1 stress protein [Tychonema bourrellyi FEM_GT703]
MSIELTKGERFNLSQEVPNFNKLAIALGWQISQTAQNCDIDASVFMLAADGRIPDEKYFVFYNNLTSPDGSVRHSGDSRSGQVEGDDETVYVDLSKINSAIQEIVFVVTLHEGQEKNQSFSQVTNAFIRLYNSETLGELVRYNLNQIFSQETALEFGRLYRKNGDWRFQAVGQGYNAGLQSFVDKYYVENAVTQGANAGGKVDDAEVLRLFSDRVDRLLREESVSSEAVEQPIATPVNADIVQSEEEAKIDDSGLESLEPAISAEEFLQRYNQGERDFMGVNLAGVNLSGKSLGGVNLSSANLCGAELSKAYLLGANLSEANLSHANLHKANLESSNLDKAQLLNANLSEVNLLYANLSEANLSGLNLSDVNLSQGMNLSRANLSNANLTGLNLRQSQLMNADLSNANLSNANLFKANLEGANLEGAKLEQALCNAQTILPIGFDPIKAGAYLIVADASLPNVNLAGVDLNCFNLSEANLSGANLTKANLAAAKLLQANLSAANLSEANLNGADLTTANLSEANLSTANLGSAKLAVANLSGANLKQANLEYANLVAADLSHANLKDTKLGGANFSDANLTGVNLVGVVLNSVNLSRANLTEVNLCGSSLVSANLNGATLSSADLRGADLNGTNLEKANLKGANLSGVANLDKAKLAGAIMPDGTIHE